MSPAPESFLLCDGFSSGSTEASMLFEELFSGSSTESTLFCKLAPASCSLSSETSDSVFGANFIFSSKNLKTESKAKCEVSSCFIVPKKRVR